MAAFHHSFHVELQQEEAALKMRDMRERAEHCKALRAIELSTAGARATLEVAATFAEVNGLGNLDDELRRLTKGALGQYMTAVVRGGAPPPARGPPVAPPLPPGSITVGTVVQALGVFSLSPEQLVTVGHRVAEEYRALYGETPPKREHWVTGIRRRVCVYTERDRALIEKHVRDAAASQQTTPRQGASPRAALAQILKNTKDANDAAPRPLPLVRSFAEVAREGGGAPAPAEAAPASECAGAV